MASCFRFLNDNTESQNNNSDVAWWADEVDELEYEKLYLGKINNLIYYG
jgi:hypothetical protein